ncbi:MAG: hypothetical protein GY790_19335 [Bacteroidetes bacterium]|nr:hypothetical protein [Bacteroidota bacterium]
MEGQTEHLFTVDGEMTEFELWEGQQKLALDLIELKAVMIPKSKRRNANPPVPWTNQDTLALFMNEHRNKIMLQNLGNTGFSMYLTSLHYASMATDDTTMFLGHCLELFAIPRSRYLSR